MNGCPVTASWAPLRAKAWRPVRVASSDPAPTPSVPGQEIPKLERDMESVGSAHYFEPRPKFRPDAAGVWIVIPCYRVKGHILKVLAEVPSWIEGVICVDDACPEESGAFIRDMTSDARVHVLRLEINLGVGGATLAGYAEAAQRGARIMVKVDGDGQMDLTYLGPLIMPIALGEADYTKGNRFTSLGHLQSMPKIRVFGNAGLSFLAKASSGYWNVFDPTNGFTAIEATVARLMLQREVSKRFFFETDLLYHLGTIRAVVRDIPIPSRYGDEVSNLRISTVVWPFAWRHVRNLARRVVGQHFVRDFTLASLELIVGGMLLIWGIGYTIGWSFIRVPGQAAPAGIVMAAALPVIIGIQFLLHAINFDVLDVPSRPIHPYLRALDQFVARR